MDELQLARLIKKCKLLKTKFVGVYPSDKFPPNLQDNAFVIVNASPTPSPGSHWLLLCKRRGKLYFADPLALNVSVYTHIYRRLSQHNLVLHELMTERLQPLKSTSCGYICIYVAKFLFGPHSPTVPIITETDLFRFLKHMK